MTSTITAAATSLLKRRRAFLRATSSSGDKGGFSAGWAIGFSNASSESFGRVAVGPSKDEEAEGAADGVSEGYAIWGTWDFGGSTETKSPVDSGNPCSFVGVPAGFFLRAGKVKSEMPPKRGRRASRPARPFSSKAFLAASSTLNDISFDVPAVCRLICAACASLSPFFLTSFNLSRYRPASRANSSTMAAAGSTLIVLLGSELRNALP